jgi:hypothetical protein
MKLCARDASLVVPNRPSFTLSVIFNNLMPLYHDSNQRYGPFRLTKHDLGAHNLLVNDDFEIIGVIDSNGIMAAAVGMVARFPVLAGLDREPPRNHYCLKMRRNNLKFRI